jgi:hypothetical protein
VGWLWTDWNGFGWYNYIVEEAKNSETCEEGGEGDL